MNKKKKLNFNLSASTINSFVSCPWSFQQDKILHRESISIPSAPLVLGQAFHKLLESFYKRKIWSTYDLFQNWGRTFDVETKLQNAKNVQGLKYARASGFTQIKNWVAMAKKNYWLQEAFMFKDKSDGIEHEFLLPYENDKFEINVHGFMDLVIEVNGRIYILDWKTGKHSEDKYYLQALIYSWALYKQHGLIEESVRFVHPKKDLNTIVDVKIKDEDYLKVANKVNQIFKSIEADYFEKRKSNNCKWCKWVDCSNNTNEGLKELIRQLENDDE